LDVTSASPGALTGRRVAGEEAIRIGLAQELVDDPLGRALELAALVASGPPLATITTKQVIRSAAVLDAPRHILEVEPALQAQMMAGAELRERFTAYREAVTGATA
jgi:enoyl-CoA hydratase